MTHMKWLRDKEIGKYAEREALDIVGQMTGFTPEPATGKEKGWDFKVPKMNDLKFEVKWDLLTDVTGNVAVETKFKGQDSGVMATEAHHIIYKLGSEFHMVTPDKLKELISQGLYKQVLNGGDEGNSEIYLFDKQEFLKHTKLIGVSSAEYVTEVEE